MKITQKGTAFGRKYAIVDRKTPKISILTSFAKYLNRNAKSVLKKKCIFAPRKEPHFDASMNENLTTNHEQSQQGDDAVLTATPQAGGRQSASRQLIGRQVDFLMDYEEQLNRIIDQRMQQFFTRANIL